MNAITRQKHFERRAALFNGFTSAYPGRSRFEDINIENLKKLIDYFSAQRAKGKLDDEVFSSLITRLCATFIEAEMAAIVNKVLAKPFNDTFGEFMNEW